MSDSDVAEILKLPPEERLRLIELIWQSLSEAASAVQVSDAHRTAVEEELAEHRRNPEDVLSLDQVLAAVRDRK